MIGSAAGAAPRPWIVDAGRRTSKGNSGSATGRFDGCRAGAARQCRGAVAVVESVIQPDVVREPALLGQLARMRAQRQRGGPAQRGGRVVPGGVEQLVLRAGAGVERGEQLALALGAVGEVLAELGGGV